MCCGREICFKQWAFGRYCGTCDTGACERKPLHERRDGVFYGNAEMIDAAEAARYRFTPERMLKVPEASPAKWFPRPKLNSPRPLHPRR